MSEETKLTYTTTSAESLEETTTKSAPIFYLISFFIFGIANLLAWGGMVVNMPFFESILDPNPILRTYFSTIFSFCSMIPLLLGNFANMGYLFKFNRNYLVLATKFICLAGFVIILITICLDCKGAVFFSIILICAFVMNFCTPIMISGFFDDAGILYFHCFSALNAGQAFPGILTAFIQIALQSINLGAKMTAILFISIDAIILFISITLYYAIIHSSNYINKRNAWKSTSRVQKPLTYQLKNFFSIFKKKWIDSLALFFTMSVTLMIYPVLMLSIKSLSGNRTWVSYFNLVHSFVIFNCFDLLGRYLHLILKFPKPGSIGLLLLSVIRFSFIPLYFICNRPNYTFIPSLISYDFIPILFSAFLGITHGHLNSIIFGIPYDFNTPEKQSDCSKLFVLILGLGLSFGALVSIAINLGHVQTN